MAKRSIPEINAGSMADIAFLLLIFFLVSTTMNVDSGIQRVLPPLTDNSQDETKINDRNIMQVMVNQYNNLLINNKETIPLTQLTERAKEFVKNAADSPELPEKEIIKIDIIGDYPVSKGVISLQNQRPTSYEMYVKVQNELTRAYNELKDELSMEKFGQRFEDLKEEEQKDAINKAIPQRISEAEPRK